MGLCLREIDVVFFCLAACPNGRPPYCPTCNNSDSRRTIRQCPLEQCVSTKVSTVNLRSLPHWTRAGKDVVISLAYF